MVDNEFLAGIDAEAIEAAINAKRAIPGEWYTSEAAFAFELREIFERSWIVAGPASSVAEAGDRLLCRAGRVPIVVVRDNAGELRAFINICPHRGAQLACDEQRRGTLQCVYHAWTFNLDGTLRKAPGQDSEPDFDPSELELREVSVEEVGGAVWVNADPEARAFGESFPEFEPYAAERMMDFEGYRYIGRDALEVDANWKLWMDNFNECYHCATVHSSSYMTAFTPVQQDYQELTFERLLLQSHAARDGCTRNESFQLFPGSLYLQDSVVAFLATLEPVDVDRSRFVWHSFVNPKRSEQETDARLDLWSRTFSEDAAIVATQQANYLSGRARPAHIMAASEEQVWHLHELVWRSYLEALRVPAGSGASG
jgi:phenylpropionate dioxygenase-like ring-hydroxylating dioxygenase large terminal subunit